MSKRIAMFNHKGGVSKTTSAYNIGWMMAKASKVLLVDADPQCNLSALVLGDKFEKYYVDKLTADQNLMDGVRPAFDAKPFPIKSVNCFSPHRAASLYLLAGHANLSEYDASLSFAQTSNNAIATLQNLPGAFDELLRLTEQKYSIDYTIIDMNPSLSAINQNLFIISDGFIVPTNPDPFSLMAIGTLEKVLPRWTAWSKMSSPSFENSAYPLPNCTPKFLGSLIQRFNIRKGRAAKPYRDNIDEIKTAISGSFFDNLSKSGMVLQPAEYPPAIVAEKYCLSQIPDFAGLLPKAQNWDVPVFEMTDQELGESGTVLDGLILRRDNFKEQFNNLAATIMALAAHA